MCSYRTSRLAFVLVGAIPLLGCGWNHRAELANYREANRELAAQSHFQLAEIENLKAHTRRIEDQLIAAEDTLARVQQPMRADRDTATVVAADEIPLWKAVPAEPATRGVDGRGHSGNNSTDTAYGRSAPYN